jgi:hypothetical protein
MRIADRAVENGHRECHSLSHCSSLLNVLVLGIDQQEPDMVDRNAEETFRAEGPVPGRPAGCR